ncbi:CLUMA_CG017568, isoform A [Clunio marinus]|uniref:CLUMA_CG017568, isoform A n=1 Tax=Clunio marinus TaxID=568069 RepID=A0A1J1IWF1_9DIPT|nr:CLUMA_CG017568, isoform A [Clunio marinus]
MLVECADPFENRLQGFRPSITQFKEKECNQFFESIIVCFGGFGNGQKINDLLALAPYVSRLNIV